MKTPFYFLLGWLLLAAAGGHAQGRYLTKMGHIDFFSGSPIEDIEANNNKVAAVLDLATGQLAFSAPIREFQFKRTLMQEHFNENYLESEKYPKATFAGRFSGADAAVLGGSGPHPIQVEGDLTMHGVTRHLTVPATLEMQGGQLLASATFNVAPADYNIEIPMLVRDRIAKSVRVRVVFSAAATGGSAVPLSSSAPTH
jgi:hypothetical protein